ncbi:glycosyl hydrolase 115 family protein [bacterium]|nr:glycosyl hydrolase 115 family protein [bacterium]
MSRLFATVLTSLWMFSAVAQEWSGPVRGSWVQTGAPQRGDVTLVGERGACEIVVAPEAHSAILRAATCLARDLFRITGQWPSIATSASEGKVHVRLVSVAPPHPNPLPEGEGFKTPLPEGVGFKTSLPEGVGFEKLAGQWEAYRILTDDDDVWLVGSNFRGTAFAAYALCERLGVDPLYHWTGYEPQRRKTLVLKKTDYESPPPSFKYRGLFHDDEDILPRPYDANGYPMQTGTVPLVWYERFFETALRLRMNQVAPYVRVQRPFEVQKTASDWGLFYTSHHYDTLLSNPWGYQRFGLGKARNAGETWDWFSNREGLLSFWRGGVLENRGLDCIWPVGMRGTQDTSYRFPAGMSAEERGRVFREVIDAQVGMTKDLLPKDKTPVFHFTLYGEMLRNYQQGNFDFPADVILVWDDNGDGVMRALPEAPGKWKHGVYYHLAFLGGTTKQTHHTVTPMRIEEEFRKIVSAGATEYMLVNVSELREFVMEARMIAEICWDATAAFAQPDAAGRYVDWFCREYYGAGAADAVEAYQRYYRILDTHDKIWYGNSKVVGAVGSLQKKFRGESFVPAQAATLPTLRTRLSMYEEALPVVGRAADRMGNAERQFFFENCALGLLIDYRPTVAAIALVEAMSEPDLEKAWGMCVAARAPLEQLELDLLWAERPPFAGWYAPTWIRPRGSVRNVHEGYEQLRALLTSRP